MAGGRFEWDFDRDEDINISSEFVDDHEESRRTRPRIDYGLDEWATSEQRQILDHARRNERGLVVITAGPGTGKTTTMEKLVPVLLGLEHTVIYLVYNTAAKLQAEQKMPRSPLISVMTLHGAALTYGDLPPYFKNTKYKLEAEIIKEIREHFTNDILSLQPADRQREKALRRASFWIFKTLARWYQSRALLSELASARPVDYTYHKVKKKHDEIFKVPYGDFYTSAARKVWGLMERGAISITHDCYLKWAQLMGLALPYKGSPSHLASAARPYSSQPAPSSHYAAPSSHRYAAPSTCGRYVKPHAVYLVGDAAQSIYNFRGARPAHLMTLRESLHPHTFSLTQSFRFGPHIACIANQLPFIKKESLQGRTFDMYRVQGIARDPGAVWNVAGGRAASEGGGNNDGGEAGAGGESSSNQGEAGTSSATPGAASAALAKVEGNGVTYESSGVKYEGIGVKCEGVGVKSEGGGVKYEVGGVKCEGGGVKSEGGGVKCEGGGVKCEGGGVKCEGVGVKSEGGWANCEGVGVKSEGGGVKYEGGGVKCEGVGVKCEGGGVKYEGGGVKCEGVGVKCEGGGVKCEGSGVKHEGSGVKCESSGIKVESSGVMVPPPAPCPGPPSVRPGPPLVLPLTVIAHTHAALMSRAIELLTHDPRLRLAVNAGEGNKLKDACKPDGLLMKLYTWKMTGRRPPGFNHYDSFAAFEQDVVDLEMTEYYGHLAMLEEHGQRLPQVVATMRERVFGPNHAMADADVILTTCHQAKGLEWDNVEVCGDLIELHNIIFGSGCEHFMCAASLTGGVGVHFDVGEKDELNLWYVACTRAKKKLILPPRWWALQQTMLAVDRQVQGLGPNARPDDVLKHGLFERLRAHVAPIAPSIGMHEPAASPL
eukprot:jgi/Mesvir1/7457/Mv19230-RA.1